MLNISEDFYSVQGEGITNGTPAYFIRLSNCNLLCGGANGSLMKDGLASWWCDTEAIWRKGKDQLNEYLISKWNEQNLINDIKNGTIHLVWTGGEPTIPKNSESIVSFLNYLKEMWYDIDGIYNEIETNGTIVLKDDLFDIMNQINCSPKLSNSGMKAALRIKPEAIRKIMSHHNYQFKFVISSEEDIQEIYNDFIYPFQIPARNIVLMPALDDQKNFFESTKLVYELGKKYHYKAISRMHIAAWNKTVGV